MTHFQTPIDQKPEWLALREKCRSISQQHISELIGDPDKRFQDCHIENGDFLFDYSKQRVDQETLQLLVNLAQACELESWRDKMFSGEKINLSEKRAVKHIVLRSKNPPKSVKKSLAKMKNFSHYIREESHITDVVNIGVGGSELGARMVCNALSHIHSGPRVHFVSNIDGALISQTLEKLNPDTTLFLIASKTFTTKETLQNAKTAKKWFIEGADSSSIETNFIALSSNFEAAETFGITHENVFPFDEWVGGRFSLWSSVGLSIVLAIGYNKFEELLDGANEMDQHFLTAPFEKNIPVLMGLLGIWNRNFLKFSSLAILPYAENLKSFPAYLQQLDMESNGKQVTRDGHKLNIDTSPVIFGDAGTNGQHAFYQMIHQGSDIIPSDFILIEQDLYNKAEHHKELLANAIAQTEALAYGQPLKEANNDPHRVFEGNKPSSTLCLKSLSPRALGQLIAAYEHKIFVQGIIWGLNSFDQPGVELGKKLSNKLLTGKLELHGLAKKILS